MGATTRLGGHKLRDRQAKATNRRSNRAFILQSESPWTPAQGLPILVSEAEWEIYLVKWKGYNRPTWDQPADALEDTVALDFFTNEGG